MEHPYRHNPTHPLLTPPIKVSSTIDLHFLDAEKCNLVTVLDAETSATLQNVWPAGIH